MLVALFLALALGGLFGNGPLSRAHADGAAGRIEYERFVRYGLSTDLVVTPAGSAHGVNRVEISAAYLEAFRIEHITPEPAAVRMTGSEPRLRVRQRGARRIHLVSHPSAALVAPHRRGKDRRRRAARDVAAHLSLIATQESVTMESVIRPALVYLFLLVLLRLTGKRTLAQITTFDFVLLLIISEATQQALIGEDNSMINGAIVVATLIGLNVLMSLLKQRSRWFDRLLDDIPLVIVADGKPLKDRMDKARVDEDDVLDAAREIHGLERMEQIRHAILERDGQISIIPR